MRSASVYSDNGTPYDSYAVLGSLVLAQPGQLAYVKLITTDSQMVGSPLTLKVQLDEIAPLSAGYFEDLTSIRSRPNSVISVEQRIRTAVLSVANSGPGCLQASSDSDLLWKHGCCEE